jgi:hypothetical protein
MNNNLEFENEDPSPDSIEDNHPRTNYGEGYGGKETLEEAAEIDLTNLCYYDKRNPDCSVDDEDIEDHKKRLLKKNKYCSCDNCFYGRTKLTEQLIRQAERMYSEEDILTNIELAMIQGLTLGEYRDLLIEQFEKK